MDTVSAFQKVEVARKLEQLAQQGVYLGTSSWKYPGWLGQVYDRQRYLHGGKFSQRRFERECLAEYAEVFPTVCVDASYYRFPVREQVARLADQVPSGFRFSFKVTEDITVARFPFLPRYGDRRGRKNPNFLSAESLQRNFLTPLESCDGKTGLLIFEFSRLRREDFARGREFVEQLDAFLGALPGGWCYGVEVRNRALLRAEYFDVLRSHGVAHIYNCWQRMPGIGEQMAMPGSLTTDRFLGARLLLKPGRRYAEAVDAFSPYQRIGEPLPGVRDAAAGLIREALACRGRGPVAAKGLGAAQVSTQPSCVYVNNRLEGNSPLTIAGIIERLGDSVS